MVWWTGKRLFIFKNARIYFKNYFKKIKKKIIAKKKLKNPHITDYCMKLGICLPIKKPGHAEKVY